MEMNTYQDAAGQTDRGTRLMMANGNQAYGAYYALGLCGEAGEVAEKIKKFIRDGVDYSETRAALRMELGDLYWYLARLAACWEFSLDEIAEANLAKLADRAARNVLSGSGDNR